MASTGWQLQRSSDYLHNLAARVAGARPAVQPPPGAERRDRSDSVREQELELLAEAFPRLLSGFTAVYGGICLLLVALFVWLVKSWIQDFGSPCDVPLHIWVGVDLASTLLQGVNGLVAYLLFGRWDRPVARPFRAYVALISLFDFAWAAVGLHLVATSETCEATTLYASTETYLLASLMGAFLICLNGTGLFAILRFLVWNGLLAATAGAPEGTLEKLQVLGFDPERPEFQDCKECSVCLVSFDASEEIRVTGCGHAFHARCLGPWLRTRRTCPLCRADAGAASGDGGETWAPPGQEGQVYGCPAASAEP
mmetsp:Transcript_59005/g.128100  ORF Transcript_59005/g.128100 Transcript_59005/m.128100 type:complete len:311 (-) Transcript_59005:116-1048(-)